MLINVAFAWKYGTALWYHVLPLVVGGFDCGFLGHSLNDIMIESGTDQVSGNIIRRFKGNKMGLLYKDALNIISFLSLLAILLIGLYLYLLRGLLVLVALAIGIFTAWAYTVPVSPGLQAIFKVS